MNKDTIIQLLEDGASFNSKTHQFFHPSFRKGWRKMQFSNISWIAAMRYFGGSDRLTMSEDRIYTLAKEA